MTIYNARNERVKRDYFVLLKEADQLAEATVDGIRKALARYEEFTEHADLNTFNKDHAIGFKAYMLARKSERHGTALSHATVYSTVQAIQQFFRWLSRQPGYKSHINPQDIRYLNLSRKDVAIATSRRTKRYPTIEQIKATIAAAPANTEIDLRNRALMAFTLLTGIRDSAIASLRLKHIDIHRKLVTQDPAEVATKFSKRIETFFFPVGDEVEAIVVEWVAYLRTVKLYGNDDPSFPRTRVVATKGNAFASAGLEPVCWSSAGQIRAIFKALFANAGMPYFNPHSLRDTLTILGEQVCQTPEAFKAWSQNLGHDSPLTTFTSYGKVALHRQGDLVRNATRKPDQDAKLDKLMAFVERIERQA